ncbi:RHS repeat domain-containing protein, partial [Flavobacterium sp.]|uniref:RHS repeat domain-containing protein n=1 Tax=Flavobacterium sp. TaxID=239 RepID=UPI003B9BDF16
TVINFQNNSGRIRYTYDALGVKLRKEVDDINGTTTTDYLDGFQYKNEVLSFFSTAEGYVEFKEPNRFFYVYNYTDHLGNVRMSYTDNGTAVPKILEESHYYPFGLKHENYASEIFERIKEPNGELFVLQPTERREWQYKYNGKEWQDELGLNFYDYGARNYDAAIGRWMNVDALAVKYYSNSPFHYADNNPILNYDVDGNYFVDAFTRNTIHTFKNFLGERISQTTDSMNELQNLLASGNLSEDSIKGILNLLSGLRNNIDELKIAISEIELLNKSTQGYAIIDVGAGTSRAVTEFNYGIVNINAPIDAGFGLLGHELHHAYQFEIGETSLHFTNSKGIPTHRLIGNDLSDEWSAYRRQNAIEPNMPLYNSYLELEGDSTGPYAKLPRKPQSVSDHAEIQTILNSNGSELDKSRCLTIYQ